MIDKEINRGLTFLHVTTGHMRKEQKAVLTVVSKRQAILLNELVHKIDSEAFIVTHEVHSVKGRGFTLPNVDIHID